MAKWNNMVRGNVIAIKTHMGWDPTVIIDSTNPMPTIENPAGLGTYSDGVQREVDAAMPELDRIKPTRNKNSNPYPGFDKSY